MDRALSDTEPYTLRTVCRLINSLNIYQVTVFCPHSEATTDLLENSNCNNTVEELFFQTAIEYCISSHSIDLNDFCFVLPDHCALKRFSKMSLFYKYSVPSIVTLEKDRNERTGKVNGIKHISGEVKKHCIILDDLCDGGRIFEEAAKVLREMGAETVDLIIPHDIMSKGVLIPGIDLVVTSNSFQEFNNVGLAVGRFKCIKLEELE
jgi:ribose-phosphate pyrophosphokinase